MLTPENPRAAQMAASGLEAMAMLAFTRDSAARRATAAATSCGNPKRRSRPEASNVTVSAAVCSTTGENSNASAQQLASDRASPQRQQYMRQLPLRKVSAGPRGCDMPRSSREQSPARRTTPPVRARIPASAKRRFWHSIGAPARPAPWAYIPRRAAGGTRKSCEMRRAVAGGVSPRSIATRPNPPPWISRSAALSACSALCAAADPEQRAPAARRRLRRMPGRKRPRHPPARTIPARAVACARIESSRLVRPEDAGPKISVRQPRGSPPMARIDLGDAREGRVSGAGRDCQSRWPPRTDSNCFLRTAAGMYFAFYSPVLYFYRKGRGSQELSRLKKLDSVVYVL